MGPKRRALLNSRNISRFACYWTGAFFVMLAHWLYVNFGEVTLPQLEYHLHFSSGLVTETDSIFLITFSIECVLGPTLLAILTVAVELWIGSAGQRTELDHPSISPSRTSQLLRRLGRILPLGALILGVCSFLSSLSAFTYIRAMFIPDEFAKSYVNPSELKLAVKSPRNLVLIYVESLEATYSDRVIFGEDLLSDVNSIAGSSFSSYLPAPATNWTMAGIVATQCGVPLQFVIGEIYSIQQARIPFLQNATCLGDILKEAGFHSVFLGGADLDFGAKNEFLIRHGYDETYGALQWKKNGVMQASNEWGMYDDDLFRTAKIKLLELKRANRPFNLTLLTVDTHQPSGYYSKTCIEHGAKRFEDIVKCTSWQLADFIAFANEHDLFKTTNFVILGDHLAHGNVVNSKLQSSPNRRIFNKFIADNLPPKNREKITPFDLFPSMLEFIGIEVPDDRLALGCSAFFNKPSPCIPQLFTNNLPGELAVSSSYRRLWVK